MYFKPKQSKNKDKNDDILNIIEYVEFTFIRETKVNKDCNDDILNIMD